MIALEPLLADCPLEPPCGPNLEYDPVFQELELVAQGKPEQSIGDQRIEAVPPDWPRVEQLATALLRRTKDLRVALLLTRAWIRADGLQGLVSGIGLLHAMLERCWEQVHPRLEDGDATMRVNTLAALADPEAMLADLRQALVAEVPHKGRVRVRDVLLLAGRQRPAEGETPLPGAIVEGLLREAAAADAAPIEAARDAAQAVRGLQALLAARVGAERAAELLPLVELLGPVSALAGRVLGALAPAAAGDAAGAPGAPGAAGGTGADAVGAAAGLADAEIRSREDALRVLDRVCAFIERVEPANPAPLFIRRAQRLMTKSFVEIIEELAPESLQAVRLQAGIRNEGE